MSKVITFVAALALGVAGGLGVATIGSKPVEEHPVVQIITGLQPKFESGFKIEDPCPEHGVDNIIVNKAIVAYEVTVDVMPFPVVATEEQLERVLAK